MTATVSRIHGNLDQATNQVLLTAAAVTNDADITYRQLDHWTRAGYLKAIGNGQGHGRHRGYTLAESRIARFMRLLIDAGLRNDAAASAARDYVENGTEIRVGIFTLSIADPEVAS